MTALAIALLAVGTFGFMLIPVFRDRQEQGKNPVADQKQKYLQEKREQVLENIVDLDAEFQMGRLAEGDYRRLREESIQEVVALEKRLESTAGGSGMGKADSAAEATPVGSQPVGSQPSKGKWYCGNCGAANPRPNRFCNECGAKIRE
ncbi:MAG: hypothetical protein HYX75_09315 [Acidobacteria bacterium]|nr:hypothetical protein [Acidobacteriota bacterium]